MSAETAKHTPGPWSLSPGRSTRVDLIDDKNGHAVGEIVWVDARKPADARLIAAAPDMLEALEEIMKTIAGCQTEFYYQLARAAIAKAKGKA